MKQEKNVYYHDQGKIARKLNSESGGQRQDA